MISVDGGCLVWAGVVEEEDVWCVAVVWKQGLLKARKKERRDHSQKQNK